jgi:hypothetical protein
MTESREARRGRARSEIVCLSPVKTSRDVVFGAGACLDAEAEHAALRRLRDAATALLVSRPRAGKRAAKRSWHAFGTCPEGAKPPCADDERCAVAVRKVSCEALRRRRLRGRVPRASSCR